MKPDKTSEVSATAQQACMSNHIGFESSNFLVNCVDNSFLTFIRVSNQCYKRFPFGYSARMEAA